MRDKRQGEGVCIASKYMQTKLNGLQREFQSVGNMISPVSEIECVLTRFSGMFCEAGCIRHSFLIGSEF